MLREINRLLRRANNEKLKNNHKECIQLYNVVGSLYTEIGSYEEAAHYHEKALQLCRAIGDRLGTATAYRYIGEAKGAIGDYIAAIEYTKKYLELTERIQNKIEVQRAWTTLGRVYLMQAQDMRDNSHVMNDETRRVASEADKKCQQALKLAESIRDQVDSKEFAEMRSALLVNIGLVKDILGEHRESVAKFAQAIELCKSAKLKEELYRCQIILTGIHRQRYDVKLAAKISEAALETAKSIGKKTLICESLIENGLVKIIQRDFKNAKRTLARAYLEKSPNEDDHAKAIKLTKLAHLISTYYDKISQHDAASETRYKLCDKLGDLFVAIGIFKMGIEFYKRAYTDAKICGKSKSELARILYSVAETYADDKHFEHAIICYEKELIYRNGNDSEQCQTLLKIAHMNEYLERDPKVTCAAYEKALDKANKDLVLMYRVLKDYVPYAKKATHLSLAKRNELSNKLLNLKSYPEVLAETEKENVEELEELEDEVANIDDVITDDEDDNEVLMIGRKRTRGNKKFKANEVGDTPLHEACIKGDFKRVVCLITQGHDVNPRDNAGWIPLHEACNHGHYEIVEYLIEQGADVNNRGLKGTSPLHDAATNGHYEIMRLLIKNGANVIALTDTGETVLGCLRDYKKRSLSTMSNSESSEYKHMEAELLNHMDKCGFNLMEENMKNLNTKKSGVMAQAFRSTQKTSTPDESQSGTTPKPTPKPKLNVLEPFEAVTDTVKEYRDIIGTLKRKRLAENQNNQNEDEFVKPSQPAIYHSETSTSASTKEWLIDDVSREKKIINRRSNLRALLDSGDEFDDDDHEEIIEVIRNKPLASTRSREKENSSSPKNDYETTNTFDPQPSTSHSTSHYNSNMTRSKRNRFNPTVSQKVHVPHKKTVLISDDELDEDDDVLELPKDTNTTTADNEENDEVMVIDDYANIEKLQDSPVPDLIYPLSPQGIPSPPGLSMEDNDLESVGNFSHSFSNNFCPLQPKFNIFDQPLTVTIEGRKLVIPLKDKLTTIKMLKEMIVERYSVLVDNAKPTISVAPLNDPSCVFFDSDLCQDVIKDHLLATVESWQLEPLSTSYTSYCTKCSLKPLSSVTMELKRIEMLGNKLDLSYVFIPRTQTIPITLALTRRDFVYVNLSGASTLFSLTNSIDQERKMFEAVTSWRRMTQFNLSCVSLVRSQFEILCSELKVPVLQSLNLSFNSIYYKCKIEFSKQVELLLDNCPKLKRLDMKKNQLQFVKGLTFGQNTTNHTGKESSLPVGEEEQNLVESLELRQSIVCGRKDLEIFCPNQSEIDVYSA